MTVRDIRHMKLDRKASREDILKQFGQSLRTGRAKRGLSQEALAEIAGFSRSYYTEIESGKRNISLVNLFILADCLSMKPSELLKFDLKDAT